MIYSFFFRRRLVLIFFIGLLGTGCAPVQTFLTSSGKTLNKLLPNSRTQSKNTPSTAANTPKNSLPSLITPTDNSTSDLAVNTEALKDQVLNSEEAVIPATEQPGHLKTEEDPTAIPTPKGDRIISPAEEDTPPITPDTTVPMVNSPDKPDQTIVNNIATPHKTVTKNRQGNLLWQRLRKGFAIKNAVINRRTEPQIKWYAAHPKYLKRTFYRARYFLYYIVSQLEKRKMPTELALLPVVESAFDPFAYSHGRASGMWQFIPSTGRIFGLKQTWWYDGRRDVVASTNAALDYLQALSKRFNGDWLLALAAYNSGAGTVSKAIRRNKRRGLKTDFWSLKLPKETESYAPKLVAIAKIIESPEKYGIHLDPIPDKPAFKIVPLVGQIDLAQAAKFAGLNIATLYRFNPGFNRWATAPGGPHRLLIPTGHVAAFKRAMSRLSNKERLTWKRYEIRRGDSLSTIAQKFNTTPNVIKQVNSLHRNIIRAGKHLLIPVASRGRYYYKLNATNRLLTRQKTYGKKGYRAKVVYKIRNGDTFWDLSRKYRVSVRDLAKWNGMAPGDFLRPGKKLVIWTKKHLLAKTFTRARLSQKTLVRKIGYRVRSGDSLARIAGKFNVSINHIAQWNKLNRLKYLQPGQKLTLYIDITDGS